MKQKKHKFPSGKKLDELIALYFHQLEAKDQPEPKETKTTKAKTKAVENKIIPPTISGLAYHLGFESREAFEYYEANGKWAAKLKRARLKIEAVYEKKLHEQPSSGAIFALKNMGWSERPVNKPGNDEANNLLKVQIIQSGPKLASSEKEVVL